MVYNQATGLEAKQGPADIMIRDEARGAAETTLHVNVTNFGKQLTKPTSMQKARHPANKKMIRFGSTSGSSNHGASKRTHENVQSKPAFKPRFQPRFKPIMSHYQARLKYMSLYTRLPSTQSRKLAI